MAVQLQKLDETIFRAVHNKDYYAAAKGLRKMQEQKLYTKLNYPNMAEYVEHELGDHIGYRTAMNLIRMTKEQKRLGYTAQQVRTLIHIGVSKAWTAMRYAPDGMPADELVFMGSQFSKARLEHVLQQKQPREAFTALISSENHWQLMNVLKKRYGAVEADNKTRNVGAAFDAFLSEYFGHKKPAKRKAGKKAKA